MQAQKNHGRVKVNELPLAAVITNLTKIQNDIKSVETSSELSGASRKSRTVVDQFNARVISNNGYVQQGQTFKADIFLSASSAILMIKICKCF